MNAYELAYLIETTDCEYIQLDPVAQMLRQQADQLAKYRHVLESIANEHVELSHDKIKWQCEDHIKLAKDVLK